MKISIFKLSMVIFPCMFSFSCFADETPDAACNIAKINVAIFSAKNESVLRAVRLKAMQTEANELFYAMKAFELSPTKHNGSQLMSAAPINEYDVDAWQSISATTCNSISNEELGGIVKLNQSLPSFLARAVLLNRDAMNEYLLFNVAARYVVDVDLSSSLSRVCRSAKGTLKAASAALTATDRQILDEELIDTKTCEAR